MTIMDSDIYILVNEKNMEQGIVLLDEYCNRKERSEVRTNYPKISEIDNKEGELIKVLTIILGEIEFNLSFHNFIRSSLFTIIINLGNLSS